MMPRFSFIFGLITGGLALFLSRILWLSKPKSYVPLDILLKLTHDAFAVYDAAGAVIFANAAALDWFGVDAKRIFDLKYPTGQPVPLGRIPLMRVLRNGESILEEQYLLSEGENSIRSLEISACRLPRGGAAVVSRDRSEQDLMLSAKTERLRQAEIISHSSKMLSTISSLEELAGTIVETASYLVSRLSKAHIWLYSFDSDTKTLTQLASAPGSYKKRPKSQKAAALPRFDFDATDPLMWQIYVARLPFEGLSTQALDEGQPLSCLALPLVANGVVLGHLSVTSETAAVLRRDGLQESLALLASTASLALAANHADDQTALHAQQSIALRKITLAVSDRLQAGALADLVSEQIRLICGADVCLIAESRSGRLTALGTSYQDALLYPSRVSADSPALFSGTAHSAIQSGKVIQTTGLPNPDLDRGIWRAFAGQSGHHSVLSLPLKAGQGVITVYRAGSNTFSQGQIEFLETIAALVSLSYLPAMSSARQPGS